MLTLKLRNLVPALVALPLAVFFTLAWSRQANAFGFGLVVTTTADTNAVDGQCSLREAILATNTNVNVHECHANGSTGTDGISFNIGAGTPVINITTPLPTITGALSIDGSGAATRVELDGPYSGTAVAGHNGLTITADNVTVAHMVIDSFEDDGINVTGNNFVLTGSYIGTNADGSAPAGNAGYGVQIGGSGDNVGGGNGTTGGACNADCNLISGNLKAGVLFDTSASNGKVEGSFIGTNAAGTAALPNAIGVDVKSQTANVGNERAGSACINACNLISGNSGDGIVYEASASFANVFGNYIGTDITGQLPLGNGRYGVDVLGATIVVGGEQGTTPGESCTGECNLIAANDTVGSTIILGDVYFGGTATDVSLYGNYIGLNYLGSAGITNGQPDEVGVVDDAAGLIIGGTDPSHRNVISGMRTSEIDVNAPNSVIQGNYIGLNSTGTDAIPMDGVGISITSGGTGVLIGGPPGAGNVISGESTQFPVGIALQSTGVTVEGNIIGPAADGSELSPFPVAGVDVLNGAKNNFIGADGYANTLMFMGYGVLVETAGTTGNKISENSIDNNGIKGIGLEDGGNNNEPAPALTSATNHGSPFGPVTEVLGTTTGTPGAAFTFELFNSPACDDTGFGEGRTYIGGGGSTFDQSGMGSLDLAAGPPAPAGSVMTATLTDANNNTSQFSNCVTVTGEATPTPSPTSSGSATPTPHASSSPTPTASPHSELTQGDVNCSGQIDIADFDLLIQYAAGLNNGTTAPGCPDLGQAEPAASITPHPWGDTDCDTQVDALDALYVLVHEAGFDIEQLGEGCAAIGDQFAR